MQKKYKEKLCIFEFINFDLTMIFFFSKIASLLRKKNFKIAVLNFPPKNVLFSYIKNFYFNFKYKKFSDFFVRYKKIELKLAREMFYKVNESKDILNLKYKEINIGIPVCQTYHRFINKKKDKVNIEDKRLIPLIAKAVNAIDRLEALKDKFDIKNLFFLHDNFIHCRIPIAFAHKYNIPVYIVKRKFIENKVWFQKVPKDIFCIPNGYVYSELKNQIDIKMTKEKKILKAKELFEGRYKFKNNYNLRFKYHLEKNMYNENNEVLNTKLNKRAIIFAHDFTDGILRYNNNIFTDYYHWLDFICFHANQSRFEFFIKEHPNSNKLSSKVFTEIVRKYNNIQILNKNCGLNFFINNKFDFLFTMHGTCVHEFAYHNIIPIVSSDHQAELFNIAIKAKSQEDLKNYIVNLDKINFQISNEKVLEYIYQRYIENHYKKTNIFESSFFKKKLIQNKKIFNKYKTSNWGYSKTDPKIYKLCQENIPHDYYDNFISKEIIF